MTDQSQLAVISDTSTADLVRGGGAVKAFAKGGTVPAISAPTEGQKDAGNYRKLHTTIHGMNIAIENALGTERSGLDAGGKKWSVTMPAHYGYVKGTKGRDGDHVDVYVGPHPDHPIVHVVDQVDHTSGRFDEHKAMVGFRTRASALEHYHKSFSDGNGPHRVGAVTSLPVTTFKKWLDKGQRRQPIGKVASPVNRKNSVPWLSGASTTPSGFPVNIDYRVPKIITVKGRTFSPDKYLVIHEIVEYRAMKKGVKYEPAHREALRAEKTAVERDGVDWNGYQEFMLRLGEHIEKAPHPNPPKRLFTKEYPCRLRHSLTKEGVRSFEEGGSTESEFQTESEDNETPPWERDWSHAKIEEAKTAEEIPPWEMDWSTPEPLSAGESTKQGIIRAAKAVAPGLGALPAMATGAKLGTEVGLAVAPFLGPAAPAAPLVGGFAGAGLGAAAAAIPLRALEEWFLDKIGMNADKQKEAQFAVEHPRLATAADIAGGLAGMSPAKGVGLATRAITGAGAAGLEAASNLIHGEPVDSTNLLMAGAAGAAFPGTNRVGRPLWETGELAAERIIGGRAAKGQSGRPDMAPAEPIDTMHPIQEEAGWEPIEEHVGGTRPGTAPTTNAPRNPEEIIPKTKTAETIAEDKRNASPHTVVGSVALGTAHEQPTPPKQPVGNEINPPVGSQRNFLKVTNAKTRNASNSEILEPEKGNIPTDVAAAITGAPLEGETIPPRRQAEQIEPKAVQRAREIQPDIEEKRDRFQELNDYVDRVEKRGGEAAPEIYDEIRSLGTELKDHTNPWLTTASPHAEDLAPGIELIPPSSTARRGLAAKDITNEQSRQVNIPDAAVTDTVTKLRNIGFEPVRARLNPSKEGITNPGEPAQEPTTLTGPLHREVPQFPETQQAYQLGHQDYNRGGNFATRKWPREELQAAYDRGTNDAMTNERARRVSIPDAAVTATKLNLRDHRNLVDQAKLAIQEKRLPDLLRDWLGEHPDDRPAQANIDKAVTAAKEELTPKYEAKQDNAFTLAEEFYSKEEIRDAVRNPHKYGAQNSVEAIENIIKKASPGITQAAVADTVTKLRNLGLDQVANAVEKNPHVEPQARRILQDLTATHQESVLVDEEKAQRARRMLERAQTEPEKEAANALMEEARNPAVKKQHEAEAAKASEQRSERRKAEGQVAQVGDQTVTTASQRKAILVKRAADAAQSAFDKYATGKIGPADYSELGTRLREAIAHAKTENLAVDALTPMPRKRTQAQEWLKAARDLVGTPDNPKTIIPSRAVQFMSKEVMLRGKVSAREVGETARIESDIARNKRRVTGEEGEPLSADWERLNKILSSEEREQLERGSYEEVTVSPETMERLIDHSTLFDNMEALDHEHWIDEDTGEITKPETETSVAAKKETAVSGTNEVGAHNKMEEEITARAANTIKKRFSTLSLKPKNPSDTPSLNDLGAMFKDVSGKLDINKVKSTLMAHAAPIKDWIIRNLMPDMFSTAARFADPKFAKRAVQLAHMGKQFRDALDAEWHAFNEMTPYDQISFMSRYEQGANHPSQWLTETADRLRTMLDNAYRAEAVWGSKAEYVENYMSHIFENEADVTKFKIEMKKRYGPTWFQQERAFKTINDALVAGFKLKYTNPIEVVSRRLMASTDMMLKMQLLNEMNAMGLAHPVSAMPKDLTGAWQKIGAPNKSDWILAPDIQALWKNGVDAQGLWADKGSVGSVYRGWMTVKNVWAPIKLSLSAFHPLHIALGVLQADNFARGWRLAGWENPKAGFVEKFKGGVSEMATNIGDPLFAGEKRFMWGGAKIAPDFIGKQVREAVRVPWEAKTPWQEEATRWAQEGGFKGEMSHEETINAQRDFAKAWQEGKWAKWIPAAARVSIEASVKPIFQEWIPNLKYASYYRTAAAYFKTHPEALENSTTRGLALRTIAKEVDNRYGEMFYGGLFWNRYLKDAAIGSFLSLGWNLGFARELGGGITQMGRNISYKTRGITGSGAKIIAHDASSKAAYVASYTGITMMLAGAMSYALSGQLPSTPMDYIFPRAGGNNPDGSPRRLSTMFYTREPIQAAAHIQEKNSVLGGLGTMLWNKMIFEPVLEAYQNRDFFGYQLYNPEAPWFKQWGQLAGSVLGDAFNPIVLSSMERAQQTGGGAGAKALAIAGFSPAPGYVSKDAMQLRIQKMFYEGPGAGVKPYENRERDQERRNARADRAIAQQKGDNTSVQEATKKLNELGVSSATLQRERYGTQDIYQFSRLDRSAQKSLVHNMNDKQFFKYVLGPYGVKGQARIDLVKEWTSTGRKLPPR